MHPRHPLPSQWLFADERLGERLWEVLEGLPAGTGVVVRFGGRSNRARLLQRVRRIARRRGLAVIDESGGSVARVHDSKELRRALQQRVPLIFISAIHATHSHPGRAPLPRMRAATLARLSGGRAHALGGVDERRFKRIEPLGFAGWGGIDAWAKSPRRK